MKKLISIVVFLLITNFSFSQTIINVEKLTGGKDSTVYALDLSYSGTQGNSVTTQLAISPAVVILKKKNEYKFFGGYALLSESENQILKNGYIHLRHNFKLSERLKTFEFYQVQFNDALRLDKREVFGAGLKYTLVNKDSLKFDFNLGIMRELEILDPTRFTPDEINRTNFLRANYANSFKWMIGKNIKVDDILYYQPYLRDFSDFRLLNEFILSISITDHIAIINSIIIRYDSQPPGTLNNFDSAITLGINLKFNK